MERDRRNEYRPTTRKTREGWGPSALSTFRSVHIWGVLICTIVAGEISPLYELTGHHASDAYVLLRVRGASKGVVDIIERRMYLPRGVQSGVINLNILPLTKATTITQDENRRIKGVSLIVLDTWWRNIFLQMLYGLITASNRCHGI